MSKLNKSKGIEAYKIVVGEYRENLVYYFIESNYLFMREELKKLYLLMKKHGYIKDYPKGAMRVAKKGSAGILCFNSIANAQSFINTCSIRKKGLYIIKVKGFDKIRRRKLVRVGIPQWKGYLTDNKIYDAMVAPKGTVAFKRIRVLE